MQDNAKVLLMVFLLSPSLVAAEVERPFLGKWQSDAAKTMQFNKQHAKLEKGQVIALEQMFGKLTLEITRTHFIVDIPAHSITRDGKTVELEASRQQVPYTVIGRAAGAVATKSKHKQLDELAIWHVEGNSMWKYVGDSPFGWLHVREYFTRVNPNPE